MIKPPKKNAIQIAIDAFKAVDDVESFLRTVVNELSKKQLALISSLIGKEINFAMKIAASKLKDEYKKINYLGNYYTYQFVLKTVPNPVSYLKSACGMASQPNINQIR